MQVTCGKERHCSAICETTGGKAMGIVDSTTIRGERTGSEHTGLRSVLGTSWERGRRIHPSIARSSSWSLCHAAQKCLFYLSTPQATKDRISMQIPHPEHC